MAHIIKGLSRLITLGLVLPVVVLMMVAARRLTLNLALQLTLISTRILMWSRSVPEPRRPYDLLDPLMKSHTLNGLISHSLVYL